MGSGFGMGQTGFMGGGGMPVEETVVNNYYDSPGGEGRHAERLADASDDQTNTSGDDDVQTQDADYDDSSDDSSASMIRPILPKRTGAVAVFVFGLDRLDGYR